MPSEDGSDALVMFRLDGQRYALPVAEVQRVIRAVEVTPLPGAPSVVLGAIDAGGRIVAVLNLRQRFLMPDRELSPDHQFLLARAGQRLVALVIDEACGVFEREPSSVTPSERIVPGLDRFQGVAQLADGLVLIHDLQALLSLDEGHALDQALSQGPPP